MTLGKEESIVARTKFDTKKMRGGAKISKSKVLAERSYKGVDLSRGWSED